MTFSVRPTRLFLKQLESISRGARQLIKKKIVLVSQNPYHFKSIRSRFCSKVFRVRLNIDGKECRMIYAVIEPNVIIVCILERKHGYADLERFMEAAMKDGWN